MNDIDELQKIGLLSPDKQYKRLFTISLVMIILPNIFVLTDGLLYIFAEDFHE